MSLIITIIENSLPAGLIVVDAAIREVYSNKSTVTSEPIEEGSEVADHVIRAPEIVVIDGVHSNYPAEIGVTLQGISPVRAEELDEELKSAWQEAKILDIFTSLRNLVNFVITDYTVTRDATSALGLAFTMTVQELVTVQSQILGTPTVPSIPRAWPPVQVGLLAGRQTTAAVTLAIGVTQIALGNAL